jgi:hypothetical protein
MAEPVKLKELNKEMLASKKYPKYGFWLSVIGAGIILVQGIMFTFVRSIWSGIEYGGWIGVTTAILGIMLIIAAIIIGTAAATLVVRSQYRVAEASTIILISFLALFLGGGYVIGSVLGIIGGLLAIMWQEKKV